MRYYLTEAEMNALERLAEAALTAGNQSEAKKYIREMEIAVSDVMGPSRNMLREMICAVEAARGRASYPTSGIDVARQLILKAQMFCVKKE